MSPQVHASPEDLRRFAKELRSGSHEFQRVASGLRGKLGRLDWKDSERQKFEQDFNQVMKQLLSFSERLVSDYAPMLDKKASALEQYQR